MDMNRNHLAIFRAVAEAGSVSGGAARLGITQPSASVQIAELEREVGTKLLDRVARGVVLTDAGRLLLGFAQRIGELEKQAAAALEEHKGLARGRLAIGASTTIGIYLLPELLGSFRRAHLAVALEVFIDNTSIVERRLEDETLDLALTEGPCVAATLAQEIFAQDRLLLIVPPGHKFAGRAHVTARQVAAEPLIMREPGSGTRVVMEQAFARAGLTLSPTMALSSSEAIKRAVMAGLGVAVISALTVQQETAQKSLAVLAVKDVNLARPLYALHRRGRSLSPAASAFMQLLRTGKK